MTTDSGQAIPDDIESDRAGPDRADPGRADPDRAGPGRAGWVEPRPWLVSEVRDEAPGVVTLALEPPVPLRFAPGQFTMLSLPGMGEVPISISGDPAAGTRVLQTIRDVGPVTGALCRLRPGQRVGVRGPYGTSWPLAAAEGGDLVIVAGGIGLPPLRPALYQALRERDRFGRVTLLYGARTPGDLLFSDELAAWRERPETDVLVTVDAAAEDWDGDVGVVPALIPRVRLAPRAVAFVVGPEVMMRFTIRALLTAGLAADRIYLSMERNMQCAVAMCGHCQLGPFLVCRDGPVFGYERMARWLAIREL